MNDSQHEPSASNASTETPGLFKRYTRDLGVLRTLLLIGVILAIAVSPFADGTERLRGWMIIPTVLAPTVMMMLLFVLPLDMTMSAVFMVDADKEGKRRFRKIILSEAIAFVATIAAWFPFMKNVLDVNPFD